MERRKDALTWDEYFIGLAHLSAYRSKDPSTQVGAVLMMMPIELYQWV